MQLPIAINVNPLPLDANMTLAQFQTCQGLDSIFKNYAVTFFGCFKTQGLFNVREL